MPQDREAGAGTRISSCDETVSRNAVWLQEMIRT